MRRLLCFSLCLGLMVSACKRNFIQEYLDATKANAKGGESAGTTTNTNTVTKKNKEAVLKACLPLINAEIVNKWGQQSVNNLFLRRNTVWDTTAADPLVVLYTSEALPLELSQAGLGKDATTVTENLNKMAVSGVIQGQFVARDNNASGWRVHISLANTDVGIGKIFWGMMHQVRRYPEAPAADSGSIIYNRTKTVRFNEGGTPGVWGRYTLAEANADALQGGWFDCVVNDTTQDVTLKYTDALLT